MGMKEPIELHQNQQLKLKKYIVKKIALEFLDAVVTPLSPN